MDWSPDSWRAKPIEQQPRYTNADALAASIAQVRVLPPLVDAGEDEGIRFVDTRHEASAMHMADAWTRVTGDPAVAMFTGGPGFSNAISGLPAIYTSESPVIFVAGCGEALPWLL